MTAREALVDQGQHAGPRRHGGYVRMPRYAFTVWAIASAHTGGEAVLSRVMPRPCSLDRAETSRLQPTRPTGCASLG